MEKGNLFVKWPKSINYGKIHVAKLLSELCLIRQQSGRLIAIFHVP